MRYLGVVIASGLGLGLGGGTLGCATGTEPGQAQGTDAPFGPGVDAPGQAIDAPGQAIDAPGQAIDAPGQVTDAPVTDAPVTDAPATDAPITTDASMPDAPITGQIDTCNQPMNITAAAMTAGGAVLTATTSGLANDIEQTTACTGYTTSGPDAIYALTVTAGHTVTATVVPNTVWDPSLSVITPCGSTSTCLAGADVGFSGDTEMLSYTTTSAGTVYVIVDGWSSTTAGSYTLTVRVQ